MLAFRRFSKRWQGSTCAIIASSFILITCFSLASLLRISKLFLSTIFRLYVTLIFLKLTKKVPFFSFRFEQKQDLTKIHD